MFKALLKKQFTSMSYSLIKGGKSKGKGKGNGALMAVLFIYVCGVVGFMIYNAMDMMCAPLVSVSLEWLYFLYACLLSAALALFISLFMVQSSLYEAKDNELVFSLPIPPKYILMCRMIPLYVQNLIFSALVIIPAYIVYGKTASITGTGILAAVLLVIFIPLFSLAIGCILGFILALISSRIRKKNVVQIALSLGFLVAYFYVYSQAQKLIQQLVTGSTEIADKARHYLFLFCKAGEGATGDIKSLLIFVGVSLLLFAVVYAVLSATYIKVVTRKRGAAKVIYKEKALKVSTAGSALFKKELKHFLGSPVYLMNTGLGTIFLVIAAVAAVIKGNWLVTMLNGMYPIPHFLPLLGTFAVSMICATNVVSAPSISLEGKNLWMVQSLPIDPFVVLFQKLRLHFVVTAPAAVVCSVVLAIVFKATILEAAFMIVIPIAVVIFTGLFGLFCNIQKPNFKWNSETEVVKQSMSVMISMLGSWGVLLIFAILFIAFGDKLPGIALLSIALAVLAIADAVLYRYVKNTGSKKFAYMG